MTVNSKLSPLFLCVHRSGRHAKWFEQERDFAAMFRRSAMTSAGTR
jgi:hypothetical protein